MGRMDTAPLAVVTLASSRDGDRQRRLARRRAADQHDVVLLRDKLATGQIANQSFVDCGAVEAEVVEVLGQGQLGGMKADAEKARKVAVHPAFLSAATLAVGAAAAWAAMRLGGRHRDEGADLSHLVRLHRRER